MRISVVIPAFREGVAEARDILSLSRHPLVFEIVVAAFQCGQDFQKALGSSPKIRVLEALQRGRGPQMNFGAEAARGDLLLFLHADSRIEDGGLEELEAEIGSGRWKGGAFRLKIGHPARKYRWKEKAVNGRSRFFRIPFGDQGYFVGRDVFKRLGGFRDWPLFEDVDFFDRLKKQGPWVLLDSCVLTSARRWEAQGYWRATFRNLLLLVLYKLGVSPFWLAKRY